MDRVNHGEILLARNRTRKQHKIYLYEAEINMLSGFAGGTVSDNIHAIVAAFLIKIGRKMEFLKERDLNRIKMLRRAITPCA
jgi:hypothetical protein